MSALVAYFSAEGNTKKIAEEFAKDIGADIYEIVPEIPYSMADINWKNPLSRCNKEWITKKEVPVSGIVEGFNDYDTVYLGFPVWYNCQPLVIDSFCKKHDFRGKKVHVFATAGGSTIGSSEKKIKSLVKGAISVDSILVRSVSDLKNRYSI
ncbi:MAG: flavodoxin [Lachnospiraceae bacterium]|nr:flavodoxin [Lachnospiraceae bacterium]